MRFNRLATASPSRSASRNKTMQASSQDEESRPMEGEGMTPYIKDFTFYKARYSSKHKEIKGRLREFAATVQQF